jgi:hypothetical protein
MGKSAEQRFSVTSSESPPTATSVVSFFGRLASSARKISRLESTGSMEDASISPVNLLPDISNRSRLVFRKIGLEEASSALPVKLLLEMLKDRRYGFSGKEFISSVDPGRARPARLMEDGWFHRSSSSKGAVEEQLETTAAAMSEKSIAMSV